MKKRNIFKLFCLCAYIVCAVVLIVEASMDGKTSSNQSSSLGGTIANIFNDLEGDQTKAVPPTSLKITNKISEAYVGDKYEIVTETLPAEATYKSVIFTSSNDKVAKVSKSGEITFLSEGNVTVSIYNKDYTSLKDSMIINVKNVLAENISSTITDANLEDGKYTLFIGNQYTINTQFTPSNTTFKDLEYELDNTKYISVDNKGVITPKVYSAGAITNITIKHGELINTIPVTVEYKNIVSLDDITVNDIEVYVTETKSLSVTYSPSNATLKDYTVTTANSKIASVSSNKIKGVKEGSTTATVTSKYYSHISKTINVTVIKQPDLESFSVSVPSVLTIGSTYQLRINNVLPKFANTSTITYSSDNASIVSVNNSGKLTAVALGSTNIIVNGTSYPIQVVDKLDKVTTGFDISINEKYSEGLNLYTNTSYTINKDANSIALISTWYPSTPSV